MNPHLLYGQAIPGICSGRGIGIIDTLHLVEVPIAIDALRNSPALTPEIFRGLQQWFTDYLTWMCSHRYGIEEMNAHNNHSVCWYVQAAIYALFTLNTDMIDYCRNQFKKELLPNQMAINGSFPLELSRTKPYGYSIFILDNMTTLCHVLSTPEDDWWNFTLADGRGIRKGIEFLYPYLEDKSSWPYSPDVEHDDGWPTQVSCLLFAGIAFENPNLIELWDSLDPDPL